MPEVTSQVLEIAIASAFVFFLLSLIASGITEALAAAFRLRARMLEKGIRELLCDEQKSDALFAHPLVAQMTKGVNRKTPSYLAPRNFTLALLDTVAPPPAGSKPGSRNILEDVKDAVGGLPEELRRQLYPVIEEAGDDLQRFRASVETWFDDAMQRVSGWYKRRSQMIVYVIAAVVTIGLNVDTVRIVERLWDDNALRQSIVGAAIETARAEPAADVTGTTEGTAVAEPTCGPTAAGEAAAAPAGEGGSFAEVEQAVTETRTCLDQIEELTLPIGWSAANDDVSAKSIVGWLITFFAVSLGAPFWFDALGRLARLRTSGTPPATGGSGGDSK